MKTKKKATKKEILVLVTGFEAFDARKENASWIAASGVRSRPGVQVIRGKMPVRWGAPGEFLDVYRRVFRPQIIIALGEAPADSFRLEARAKNKRDKREDNLHRLPDSVKISSTGPKEFRSANKLNDLAESLGKRGFPTVVSEDAGGFLCNEMLYEMETLRNKRGGPKAVLFAHVPHLNRKAKVNGKSVVFDRALLRKFASALLSAVLEKF